MSKWEKGAVRQIRRTNEDKISEFVSLITLVLRLGNSVKLKKTTLVN